MFGWPRSSRTRSCPARSRPSSARAGQAGPYPESSRLRHERRPGPAGVLGRPSSRARNSLPRRRPRERPGNGRGRSGGCGDGHDAQAHDPEDASLASALWMFKRSHRAGREGAAAFIVGARGLGSNGVWSLRRPGCPGCDDDCLEPAAAEPSADRHGPAAGESSSRSASWIPEVCRPEAPASVLSGLPCSPPAPIGRRPPPCPWTGSQTSPSVRTKRRR